MSAQGQGRGGKWVCEDGVVDELLDACAAHAVMLVTARVTIEYMRVHGLPR